MGYFATASLYFFGMCILFAIVFTTLDWTFSVIGKSDIIIALVITVIVIGSFAWDDIKSTEKNASSDDDEF